MYPTMCILFIKFMRQEGTLFYTKQWIILAKCIQLTSIILVQIGSSNVNLNPFSYIFIHRTIPKTLI